jgi:phosphotransferase system  glucose/maltose/N-acetylglucosamine-specific IIC component
MFGLDWTDHRIIGITVALIIILISIISIVIRFYVHKHVDNITKNDEDNNASEKEEQKKKPRD